MSVVDAPGPEYALAAASLYGPSTSPLDGLRIATSNAFSGPSNPQKIWPPDTVVADTIEYTLPGSLSGYGPSTAPVDGLRTATVSCFSGPSNAQKRCSHASALCPADDRHLLSKLHVPFGDTPSEFDEQILILAKLVVDSINEEAITNVIGKGPKGEKGLAKLERFLAEKGAKDARQILSAFGRVQGLRSRGAAHTKGSDFDISVAVGDAGRQDGFRNLLSDTIETLEALRSIADAESTPDDSSKN